MEDNICAISTALGVAAISIVKVSGPNSIEIVNKIFQGKDLTKVDSHTVNYGFIKDKDEIIDEVIVTVMKAPRTYTTEDVVEINCHGGIATTNKVLEVLLINGCRLAEGGEFTKRAFLNGRIDLVQAEATGDLINSTTQAGRSLLLGQVQGKLSKIIKNLRKKIINLLANIAVNIDYPEYDDAIDVTLEILKEQILEIKKDLEKILSTANDGKIIKEGINVVLVGRPNVGKSSLLNRLLDEEKAIVTDIEGTTRDIVEGQITIKGIKFNFIDTAGIRETNDVVEQIGVQKSKEVMDKADLVIGLFNSNEPLNKEDQEILEQLQNYNHLIFLNKNDLNLNIELDKIKQDKIVFGNTIENDGIESLKERLIDLFQLEKLNVKDFTYVSNARQIALLRTSLETIKEVLQQIEEETPVDIIEIDIKNVFDTLGEITGETYKDELLDELFSNFCLGK